MDFLRRFFGGAAEPKDNSPLEAFQINFDDGAYRPAVRVTHTTAPQAIIDALRLPAPFPAILIGASAKTDISMRSVIEDGLVRFLSERQINLLDGGTSSNIMHLIGGARGRRGSTFPLIRVVPEKLIAYPGWNNPHKLLDLASYYSHIVLTSGDEIGAETELVLQFAYKLSGSGTEKRLIMVINGGDTTRQAVIRCATQEPRFPLLVFEGSGRLADELALARRQGSDDPQIQAVLNHGIVHFISARASADQLYRWLENFFGY
ncbi:MAG: hypothetical protein GC204_12340 [Chloroflexi bacterium]|nr:hypothetical protein [Chloroflexota bacterium]